jgi:hypothetical protein
MCLLGSKVPGRKLWHPTFRKKREGWGTRSFEAEPNFVRDFAYALTILPALMQRVQTRIRLLPPSTAAFTGRRLTFQRRLETLWACEILLPNCGPLPQILQT